MQSGNLPTSLPGDKDETSRRASVATAARAHRAETAPFRVLVVPRSKDLSSSVRDWAEEEGHAVFCTTSPTTALELAREHHPEVLLVDLLLGENQGVAVGIELLKVVPGAEILFLVDGMDLPEIRAARAVGISRFVPSSELADYLAFALRPLAQLARARRALLEAQSDVESLPSAAGPTIAPALPLAVAERRYREAYLRAALAKAGGRRAAARLAGVPYTTFCVMLRKLGINPREDESQGDERDAARPSRYERRR